LAVGSRQSAVGSRQRQVSSIQYPASSIQYPASSIILVLMLTIQRHRPRRGRIIVAGEGGVNYSPPQANAG